MRNRIERARHPGLHDRWAVAVAASALLAIIPSRAWAQTDWSEVFPSTSPPARSSPSLAFDSARNRTVLFGGSDSAFADLGDTWEWDGSNWTQRTPANSPTPRSFHATAFDSGRGRTVLFGGNDTFNGRVLGDTWEWDGTDWTRQIPATSPPARSAHTMTYDSLRGRTILYGGFDSIGIALSDTWEWDGSQWTPIVVSPNPGPRAYLALAYDSARGRTVLFGGFSSSGIGADTWEFDGSAWMPVAPATMPSARGGCGMVFEPIRQRTVLFGGSGDFSSSFFADTWEWDGINWNLLPSAANPTGRVWPGLARDAACGRLVLFGGLPEGGGTASSDTWQLAGSSGSAALTTVAPNSGSEAGGETVNLFGSGFTDIQTTIVTFGGVAATVLSVTSDHVVVRAPSGAGVVDVRIDIGICVSTLAAGYRYVAPELAARYGNVNVGRGDREDVLLVNASAGDALTREVTVGLGQPLRAVMASPSSRGASPFAAYIWLGASTASTLRVQPRGLGIMSFPTPLNVGQIPQPRKIFNNFDSRLGSANLPSSPAPSTLLNRPGGLSTPITITLQGFIRDGAAQIPQGVSITNGVVLRIQ
ncbi:MAG: IPT/TIG domain-containing protein [Planctomycetes bacterium]|nr:IPT/TIG domain-containing protein [Planctomycetota bacterium]